MPTYIIQLADRETGATSIVEVDAISKTDAVADVLATHTRCVVGAIREKADVPAQSSQQGSLPIPGQVDYAAIAKSILSDPAAFKLLRRCIGNGVAVGLIYFGLLVFIIWLILHGLQLTAG